MLGRQHAAAIGLCLLLGGCVGAAAEGANIARDEVVFENNIEAARAGNAEAQFKVGDALCCSVNEGTGFYDTPKSVDWLCSSAEQSYGPAAMKLGRIYSGDVVEGVRLMRRVAQRMAGSTTSLPVAYAWFRRAAELGEKDAAEKAKDLMGKMTPAETDQGDDMASGRSKRLCRWEEVVGQS